MPYELTLRNQRDSHVITRIVEETPEAAINAMREKGGYELTLKDMNNNCVLNRVNGNSRDAVLKLMGEYVTFKFTPITIRINPIHIGRRH